MFTYSQSSGKLTEDATDVATGYSGIGEGKNNPNMQDVPGVGPLPRAIYEIGGPFDSEYHGPLVLTLTPQPGSEMFGRSGFLCHGDSLEHPGMASHGCMVMPRKARQQMLASADKKLEVIA